MLNGDSRDRRTLRRQSLQYLSRTLEERVVETNDGLFHNRFAQRMPGNRLPSLASSHRTQPLSADQISQSNPQRVKP